MLILQEHTVPANLPKIRLLDYVLLIFSTIPSRSGMKKVIKSGSILVDGEIGHASSWVSEGQKISLVDLENKPPKPLNINLEIIFEDEHIAVINKPAGIEVSGNKYYTIQNALVASIKPSIELDALKWPRPVHRLDMPTSGLLLVAKTATALMNIGQQFEKRLVQKKYLAIVAGNLSGSGEIKSPIEDQEAQTQYRVVSNCHSLKTNWLSLVELFPHTGRTHQLRIHMANYGYPIVGDRLYGSGPLLRGKGLFLSAVAISFTHPKSNKPIEIHISQPKKFDTFLNKEEHRWNSYNKNDPK